ncbi:MAG TPA: serine hydrolase, partial [Bacteroidales bacterium]|nr:serine hydrolase [Bacteroidales bacterium]
MKKRIVITACLTVVVALTVYLSVPQNHYIVKALIHQKPKIYHNTIFANRLVKVGEPDPWQTDSLFDAYHLTDNQLKALDSYKTVALLVARDSLLLF